MKLLGPNPFRAGVDNQSKETEAVVVTKKLVARRWPVTRASAPPT